MITFTLTACNETPADGSMQARFDELGGTIGRAPTNQFVLPDPQRVVSRVAAQVVYRGGAFAIIARGSNPITLNARELANGKEEPLASGDCLHICGYELSIAIDDAGATAAGDPFAGLLGSAGAALSPGASRSGPMSRPEVAKGDAIRPAAERAPRAGGIPTDWDPFAIAPGTGRPEATSPSRRDGALGLEIGAAAAPALIPDLDPASAPDSPDRLFGLSSSSGGDPLADSVLDAPIAHPNMAGDADPLLSLRQAPKASGSPEADQLSDLHRPFIPPTVIPPAPAAGPPHTVSGPAMPRNGAAACPAGGPSSRVMAPSTDPASAAQRNDRAALLDALRRGLRAPALEPGELTPALMESVGQLLYEAVEGTVHLLRARSAAKHASGAGVTVVAPAGNNPLKFSPNAEVALRHLLANAPARGFMAPPAAMREAYEDLWAHQSAFTAGMQAVLEAVLQRLDPAALDARRGAGSRLGDLLPAGRDARLWSLFNEQYARTCQDARTDLHGSFGQAFRAAYEKHLRRARDPGDARPPGD